LTIAKIVLVFIGLWASGFATGYWGKWTHTASLLALVLGSLLAAQVTTAIHLGRHGLWNEVAGGDVSIAWLLTFGSLIGQLLSKKYRVGYVLLIHGGFACASLIIVQSVQRLLHGA
jgi:hypothetical protein